MIYEASLVALKVAARFQREADQYPGARKDVRDLVQPVNKPRGLSRDIKRDFGETDVSRSESTKPDRRDLRPKDLFQPTPRTVNVLNYVEKDYTDMSNILRNQIQKDKGYDTVSNLSQYLVETEGGGGTQPVKR